MALIVDAAGKKTANPKTGKVFDRKPTDVERSNETVSTASAPSKTEQLAINEIKPEVKPIKRQQVRSFPSVQTASMPVQTASSDVTSKSNGEDSETESYWTKARSVVSETDEEDVKPNGITPSFTTTGNMSTYDGLLPLPTIQTASMSAPQAPEFPINMNDVYENDMIANGMSADYLNNVVREPNTIAASVDYGNGLSNKERLDLMSSLTTTVDDGTMDRPHLLSDIMTGKQYYHYVHDLGLPGMPENQIDISDDARYSKEEEHLRNGFSPYSPTVAHSLGRVVPDIAAATRLLSDHVSNLRTRGLLNDVDYDIHADTGYDSNATFSGRDFENLRNGYLSQMDKLYEDASNGDVNALSSYINGPSSGQYSTMVKQFSLPDGSMHYGVLTGLDVSPDVEDINDLIDPSSIDYGSDGNPKTIRTLDGTTLNMDGFNVVEDDTFYDWYNSHLMYQMSFSDGSSASIPLSDMQSFDKDDDINWVMYEKTDLNVDPTSLNVGNPKTLNDSLAENGAELGAYYVPDMILSDGTRVPFDVAYAASIDEDPDDTSDGISYTFQRSGLNPLRLTDTLGDIGESIGGLGGATLGNIGKAGGIALGGIGGGIGSLASPLLMLTDSKPRRLMHQSPIDEEGIHILDLPNNLADWSANSATISAPYYQWVDALSHAMPYAAGTEATQRDESGVYRTTGWDPETDEGAARNALLSVPVLAGPALENLAGNIGHETWLDKPANRFIDRYLARGTLGNLLAHHGFDMAGEGAEENVGDVVDELATYGRDAYANRVVAPTADMAVYDEDGNLLKEAGKDFIGPFNGTLYDEHGVELRDPNTSIGDRISNFVPHTPEQLREGANSFIGGAGVSALMGFPGLLYGGVNNWAQRSRGDFGSPSYAAHMNALNRDMPYAGMSFNDVKRDIRLKSSDAAKSINDRLANDIDVPVSLTTSTDRSDIISYDPEKYLIPKDAPIRRNSR